MKIALVNPRNIDTPNHPLGLLYIAAVLEKENFTVKVFDQDMDTPPEHCAGEITAWGPDLVGVTATTPQWGLGLSIAAEVKKRQPALPVVFGGPHPTVCSAESLERPEVDYIVVGEGEYTMAALCRRLRDGDKDVSAIKGLGYKLDGKPVFTGQADLIANLDDLPFPARHLLSSRWYFAPPRIRGVWTESIVTVMASRGCPYKCVWCSSFTTFGRTVRFRSAQNVFDEIAKAREEFGADSVWFADDTFTLDHAWVERLCGLIVKAGWKDFKWACQARVNTVTPKLLQIMKSAGCVQLDFGVESGSERVLKVIQKDITLDQIRRAFRETKALGINCFSSIMIGTPGETREDIDLTAKLLDEIQPDYAEIYYATPYPGTRLYEIAKSAGLLKPPFTYDKWYVSKSIDKPFVCMSFTEDELIGFRRMLQDRVRKNNFRTLLRDPGFIFGGLRILFFGLPGLPAGIRRFISTGDLDSVLYELLREYRRKTKTELQGR